MAWNDELPPRIEPLQPVHLPQLQALVSDHLCAIAPGWALSEAFIASHLERNPQQSITDPWVIARKTLCALGRRGLLAAAHLLRYGAGPEVSPSYTNAGEIAWFLAWPEADKAASALLAAASAQMAAWGVTHAYAWGTGLPIGPFVGVPDAWPHIAAALMAAGYRPSEGGDEVVYGGRLDLAPPAAEPPAPGVTQRRTIATMNDGVRFSALDASGQTIGTCDVKMDLTHGGVLPALRGWVLLQELRVDQGWRSRGIGSWLVRHAAVWLRLGGCDRIILATELANAGARRLYERLGWDVFAVEQKGWQRALAEPAIPSTSSGQR